MGVAGNSAASRVWKGVNMRGHIAAGGCLYPSAALHLRKTVLRVIYIWMFIRPCY